jgi:hypothetical protein
MRAAGHNLLGAIHANLGQRQEARAAFEAALRLDTKDVTAYTNLALLELSSGNKERPPTSLPSLDARSRVGGGSPRARAGAIVGSGESLLDSALVDSRTRRRDPEA